MAQRTGKTKKTAGSGKTEKEVKVTVKKEQVTALSDKVEPDIVRPEEPDELKISIQSVMGGSISLEEVVARVHASAPDALEIYIKPEDNKAYYVGKTSSGYIVLWE